MDHDTLDRLRQVHPAWRILVADHAPLVLSFLSLAFIQPDRRAIPAPERMREGRAGPLDATQVKERYAQVADTARRLLADFRQVEENFRVLDSQTRERIATSTQPKGALLEEIFGETDHIHCSDRHACKIPGQCSTPVRTRTC